MDQPQYDASVDGFCVNPGTVFQAVLGLWWLRASSLNQSLPFVEHMRGLRTGGLDLTAFPGTLSSLRVASRQPELTSASLWWLPMLVVTAVVARIVAVALWC